MYLQVTDLALRNEKPAVNPGTPMKEVIIEISAKRLGMTAVLERANRLVGIITDGDLRRMLKSNPEWEKLTAADVMHPSPRTIGAEELAVNALAKMRQNNITQLIISEKDNYIGVVHLHDLLKEGLL